MGMCGKFRLEVTTQWSSGLVTTKGRILPCRLQSPHSMSGANLMCAHDYG